MPGIESDDLRDERRWAAELEEQLGYPVLVHFGRSRTSPVQLRAANARELRDRPALRDGSVVRLHAMFASAPDDVLVALASWIRVGRRAPRASRRLGEWIEAALSELPASARPRSLLEPRGACHDLAPMAAELYATELAGEFEPASTRPAVTWGRRGKSATRGSLRLGSFEPTTRVARLHRVLDQPAVPDWFVRYVLFHELLHAAVPPERGGGGRYMHHSPRFRAREERYPDYDRALVWQNANIEALVRSARRDRPMRAPRRRAVPGVVRALRQLELFRT